MGLSNQERKKNIIECIKGLTSIKPFTVDLNDDKFEQINIILNDLWFYLFGQAGNSSHWFAGSSSDNLTLSEDDVFGLAMITSYCNDSDIKLKIEKSNPFKRTNGDDVFGPGSQKWFDYCNEFKPNALSLLKKNNDWQERQNQSHDILLIFKYIEGYFYNVNRYQDDLSKSFETLTKQISKLKGLCFKIMGENPIYFKAYAGEIIFDKVLSNHTDDINEWFMNNCLHHSVNLEYISNEDLKQALAECQKNHFNFSKMKSNDRIILILKFLGNKFRHKYEHEKLFKLIEEHNVNFIKDKINLIQIKKLCEVLFNNNKEQKKDPLHWNCDLTGENVYKNRK